MSTITTKDGTQIFYKDWGTGTACGVQPRLAAQFRMVWEAQMVLLADHGYRCVAHDNRGHGRPSQPWSGRNVAQKVTRRQRRLQWQCS